MNERVKSLIAWWGRNQSSVSVDDPFIKFFLCYVCFDAWTTSESGKDSFNEKLDWLQASYLKDRWKNIKTHINGPIADLKKLSYIKDMLSGKEYTLDKVENFDQMIHTLHRIRCNLFHGSKHPENARDKNFVENGVKILEKLVAELN